MSDQEDVAIDGGLEKEARTKRKRRQPQPASKGKKPKTTTKPAAGDSKKTKEKVANKPTTEQLLNAPHNIKPEAFDMQWAKKKSRTAFFLDIPFTTNSSSDDLPPILEYICNYVWEGAPKVDVHITALSGRVFDMLPLQWDVCNSQFLWAITILNKVIDALVDKAPPDGNGRTRDGLENAWAVCWGTNNEEGERVVEHPLDIASLTDDEVTGKWVEISQRLYNWLREGHPVFKETVKEFRLLVQRTQQYYVGRSKHPAMLMPVMLAEAYKDEQDIHELLGVRSHKVAYTAFIPVFPKSDDAKLMRCWRWFAAPSFVGSYGIIPKLTMCWNAGSATSVIKGHPDLFKPSTDVEPNNPTETAETKKGTKKGKKGTKKKTVETHLFFVNHAEVVRQFNQLTNSKYMYGTALSDPTTIVVKQPKKRPGAGDGTEKKRGGKGGKGARKGVSGKGSNGQDVELLSEDDEDNEDEDENATEDDQEAEGGTRNADEEEGADAEEAAPQEEPAAAPADEAQEEEGMADEEE